MKTNGSVQWLLESLEDLQNAEKHLRYSYGVVEGMSWNVESMGEDELERIEAFTSRFSRLVDLLANKVFRAIDRFELYETGTLIDTANRSEKRGLIPSTDWLRELKDVRNRIAHDYAGVDTQDIFAFCREKCPELLETCEKTREYAKSRLYER